MSGGMHWLRTSGWLVVLLFACVAIGGFAVQVLRGSFTPSATAAGSATMLVVASPTSANVTCSALAPAAPSAVSASVQAGDAVGFRLSFSAPATPQQRVSVTSPFGVTAPAGKSPVTAVAVQTDGKVVIGGNFTAVNGTARGGIARLNADGSLDTGFQNGLAGVSGGTAVVNAVAVQTDGKVVIGGSFTAVNGTARNNIARLNSDGTLDTTFGNGLTGANAAVSTLVLQSDGKVLVGGYFSTVNGATRSHLSRLNTDGTTDTFGNGLGLVSGDTVQGVAVQSDGKVLIVGDLVKVNATSRATIARLNTDATLDTGLANVTVGAGIDLPLVTDVAVQPDGKILMGGFFTTVGGVSRAGIFRITTAGAVDTAFNSGLAGATGGNNTVSTVIVQSDSKIVIGGGFTAVNGVARGGVARLNTDGTLDTGFQSGLAGVSGGGSPSRVLSVAMQSDGKIVVGGWFDTLNGTARPSVARVGTDGSLDTTFPGDLPVGFTYKFDSDASTPTGTLGTTADSTTSAGAAQNVTVKWQAPSGWTSQTGYVASCPATTITSYEISLDGGSTWTNVGLIASPATITQGTGTGQIPSSRLVGNTSYTPRIRAVSAGGTSADGIAGAAVRTTSSAPTVTVIGGALTSTPTFRFTVTAPAGEPAPYSYQYTTDGGSTWATLCTYSATPQNCDKTTGSDSVALTFDTTYPSVAVRAVGLNGGVSGVSTTPGSRTTQMGPPAFSVLRGPNATARLGIQLTGVNSITRYTMGRLSADGLFDQNYDPFSTSGGSLIWVNRAVTQSDNKIIVGGNFTAVNGTTRGRIARLNADGSLDTSFGNGLAGASNTVSAVALQSDGKILIGGTFTTVNGTAKASIARLNTDGTLDTGFTASVGGTALNVQAIVVQSDGKILIGGNFTTVNGVINRNYLARLNTDGTTDTGWVPQLSTVTSGFVDAIVVQTDGDVVVGGLFQHGGSPANNNLVRLSGSNANRDTLWRGVSTSGRVNALGIQSDGKIVVGGQFSTLTGSDLVTVTRGNIGRFNTDGTVDTGFANGLDGVGGSSPSVFVLLVQPDDEVVLGGTFQTVNDVPRNSLARLHTDGSLDADYARLGGTSGYVMSLARQSDGTVLAGLWGGPIYGGLGASAAGFSVSYSTNSWLNTATPTQWTNNLTEFPNVYTFTTASSGTALSTATSYTVLVCLSTVASGVCGAPGSASAVSPFLSPTTLPTMTRTTAAPTTDSGGTTLSGCATTCQPSEAAVHTTSGTTFAYGWTAPTLGTGSPAIVDYDYEYDTLGADGTYSGVGSAYRANDTATAPGLTLTKADFALNTQYQARYRACFVTATSATGDDPNCSAWSAWGPSFTPLSAPAAPTVLGGYGAALVGYSAGLWSGGVQVSVPGAGALKADVRRSSPWKDNTSNRWDGVGASATSASEAAVWDLGLGMGASASYQYRIQAPDGSRSQYSPTASATTITPSNSIAQPCSGTGWTNYSGTSQASSGIEAWGSTCNYVSGSNQYSVCSSVTTGTTNGCWSLDASGTAPNGFFTANKYLGIFFKPTTATPAAAGTIVGLDYSTYSQFYIRQNTNGTVTGCGRQGEGGVNGAGTVLCSTTTGAVTAGTWHLGVLSWVSGTDAFGNSKYVRVSVYRDGDVATNPNLVGPLTALTGTNNYLYADALISIYPTLYVAKDYNGNNWSGNTAWFMAG